MSTDPYLYPGTDVLINLYGLHDRDELAEMEASDVWTRFGDLYENGIAGALGPDLHRRIHHHLFQDVYPFAGKFRTIDIAKEGEIRYASAQFLQSNAEECYAKIQRLFAETTTLDTAIDNLATIMGDLHVLHPFREGNTRTLQGAAREIAWRNGYDIQWKQINPKELRLAGTSAAVGDLERYSKALPYHTGSMSQMRQKCHSDDLKVNDCDYDQ